MRCQHVDRRKDRREAHGMTVHYKRSKRCAACLELAALLEELGEEVDMNDR